MATLNNQMVVQYSISSLRVAIYAWYLMFSIPFLGG